MDAYEKITRQVIDQLESGVIPWHKPFTGINGAMNYVSRRPYSLLNQFLLGKPGEYLTPRQAMDLGGDFRGAKTETIYFYKIVERKSRETTEDEDGKKEKASVSDRYPILKSYNVLHVSSVRGIESRMEKEAMTHTENVRDSYIDDAVLAYLLESGTALEHDTYSKPSYSEDEDTIRMPHPAQFESTEAYYAALMGKLALSAAREGRCDWNIGGAGGEKHARIELASEMTAVFLCNHFELDTIDVFNNSVAYIKKWTDALRADKHLLTWAAAKAEKAAKFILECSEEATAAAA